MRIVCISDTHTQHDKLEMPAGDVLICAGDFTGRGSQRDILSFGRWLAEQPYAHKVVIAGNHELTFESAPSWALGLLKGACPDVTYLLDEACIIDGYKFYGSPWSPLFCNWAFNVPRALLHDRWAHIPDDTDVLITHTPPHGICDYVPISSDGLPFKGCAALLERVHMVKPKLHVFGHIHYSYGKHYENGTTFINAANCSESYECVNPPIVVELEDL